MSAGVELIHIEAKQIKASRVR